MASLMNTFQRATSLAFEEGRSKYDDRRNGENTNKHIYSHSSFHNMRNFNRVFVGWCKENGITKLDQINPTVTRQYIDEKLKQGTINLSTAKAYESNFKKLGVLVGELTSRKFDIAPKQVDTKQYATQFEGEKRTLKCDEKDYQRLIDNSRESASKMGYKLSHAFGLRVSEITKLRVQDIKENKIEIVGSKGGRNRTLNIENEEQRQVVNELKDKYLKGKENTPNAFVFTNKDGKRLQNDSINKAFSRGMKRLGIDKYTDAKTGIHSIRKNYATREYQALREKGYSHKTAWGDVSEKLGHGRDREDLFKVYVKED